MIIETTTTTRKQVPSDGMDWLYKDTITTIEGDRVINRTFTNVAYLVDTQQEWNECTQAEYDAWKAAHPDPEQIETLNMKVTRLIRREYDQSQENHMNRIGGKIVMNLATEEEKAEWLTFNTYVEQCIAEAKEEEPEA